MWNLWGFKNNYKLKHEVNIKNSGFIMKYEEGSTSKQYNKEDNEY